MKINSLFLAMLLLYTGCKVAQVEQGNQLRYSLVNNFQTSPTDSCTSPNISIDFKRANKDRMEFMVNIKNNTPDTIIIDPSVFFYYTGNDPANKIYHIDPDNELLKLNKQLDSLLERRNPYSLNNKKIKEIITDGLIQGSIATIFGMKPEKLEQQRLEDENNWNSEHYRNIQYLKKEQFFWKNNIMRKAKINPQSQINGIIAFPLSQKKDSINICLPVNKKIQTITFIRGK